MDDLKSNPSWEQELSDTEKQKLAVHYDLISMRGHGWDALAQPTTEDMLVTSNYVDHQISIGDISIEADTAKVPVVYGPGNRMTSAPSPRPLELQNIDGRMTIEADSLCVKTPTEDIDIVAAIKYLEKQVDSILAANKTETVMTAEDTASLVVDDIRRTLDQDMIAKIMKLSDEIDNDNAFAHAMKGV